MKIGEVYCSLDELHEEIIQAYVENGIEQGFDQIDFIFGNNGSRVKFSILLKDKKWKRNHRKTN